jgi:beta-phosphoglucomutase-like phosphatase (HAD superfamily)
MTMTIGFSERASNRQRATIDPAIPLDRIDAVVLDADSVVTDTSRVHAAAWKRVLDGLLRQRAGTGGTFEPFDVRGDYLRHLDGSSSLEGVGRFLASRGFALPEGTMSDEPGIDTLHALAARKDAYYVSMVLRDGVAAFPSAISLLLQLRRRGARVAAVSPSVHMGKVLRATGIVSMFDIRVDGVDVSLLCEAARRLGALPYRLAVVEDSITGMEAGRRSGFGLVIGVDRGGETEALYAHGADIVVSDLIEIRVAGQAI